MATNVLKDKTGQFRVAAIGEDKCTLESYNRRDFYKISLVTHGGPPCQLFYGSLEPITIDRPAMILLDPMVPHSWVVPERTIPTEGYFCVFDADFTSVGAQLKALANRLFTSQGSPVYFPEEVELHYLKDLFARMRMVADSNYVDKDEIFRNHLSLIFHEALQIHSAGNLADGGLARIANGFADLLRRQFPVDLPLQPIKLKTASDFADRLAVHVNYLNRAVQEITGKSTTKHISEQLFTEARSLLSFTSYNIAEIADGLGFEYQSYFNRFFRKFAGLSPSEFRKGLKSINSDLKSLG